MDLGGAAVRQTDVTRVSRLALVLMAACLASACGGIASPGPVDHSPFDLPSATWSIGVYLRNCLAPSTGLALGSGAPVRIDSANVKVIVRCEPDSDHNAVRVSEATGDVGPLLDALATRPAVTPSSTGKQTIFIVFNQDDTTNFVTATGVPAAAVSAAKFQVIGTTPSGSL